MSAVVKVKLGQLFGFGRSWWWLMVAFGLIPVVILGGRIRPSYTATARVQITLPPPIDVVPFQQPAPFHDPRDDLDAARANFIQAAFTPEVRNRTVTSIGLANADFGYVALVTAVPGSDFVDIRVTSSRSAESAAITANAHANAAIAYSTELRALPTKAMVAFLTSQLQSAEADTTRYKLIEDKLDEARIKSTTDYAGLGFHLAIPATPPTSANFQQVYTSLALFVLGGIVASVIIARLLGVLAKSIARRVRPRYTTIVGGMLACAIFAALFFVAPTLVLPNLPLLAAGGPFVWLLWTLPELGLLGVVGLAAGLLPLSSLYVPLPVGGIFGHDVVLLALFALVSLRALFSDGLRIDWMPVTRPLLVFLALASVSVVYAVGFAEIDVARSLNEFRPLFYYSASIVVAMALNRPSTRTRLLIGLFLLSDLVSAALVVQQFVGARNFVLPGMISWQVNEVGAGGVTENGDSLGGGFGLVRIVPPANVLMFVMMILALVWTLAPSMRKSIRVLCAAQFVLLNVGLLLTYTRAQWIASILSVAVIAFLAPGMLRARLVKGALAALALCVVMFGLYEMGLGLLPGDITPAADALLGRFTSILSPDATLNSSSLQWRAFETEEAFNSLARSPAGVGLGNTYRGITTYAGEAAGYQGAPLNGFMHNSYLYIAVKTGFQGLAAFLWLCLAFLYYGWRLFRTLPDSADRWLVLAALASFVGVMQWSVTEPNFMQTGATVTVGLMVGILASIASGVLEGEPLAVRRLGERFDGLTHAQTGKLHPRLV